MHFALCSGIICFGAQFSEQHMLHVNFGQQGAGNVWEMTADPAADEF